MKAAAPSGELHPAQFAVLVASIVGLHLAGTWGLLQIDAVRESVLQAVPIFVSLLNAAAPAPPQQPVEPSAPARPEPIRRPSPRPKAVIAAPATLSAEPSIEVTVPVPPSPVTAPAAVVAAPPTEVAPAVPAPEPEPAAPRRIPDSAVEFVVPPDVVYPRLSQRRAEDGLAIVRALVGTSGGAPDSVQIERSSGHARLDQAALSAVRSARFKPYAEKGQPVAGWALIPILFELER